MEFADGIDKSYVQHPYWLQQVNQVKENSIGGGHGKPGILSITNMPHQCGEKCMTNNMRKKPVQITVTEKCNLKCIYCYEHAKDCGSLTIDKVKSILVHELADPRFDELEIDFHGGEPALAFDVIKPVCEWLWSEPREKPYLCFASTNGTLIQGRIKEWFRKNAKRFWLSLSLDGTREMHNFNRSSSYDAIDIGFFREMWPKQTVKMTISPHTLPNVAEGIKHIHSWGFELTANLAHGMSWPSDLIGVYRDELNKVADFYLSNPQHKPCRIVNFDLKKIGMESLHPEFRKLRRKWCGSGDPMICYAVNGNSYPCQLFAPSSTSANVDSVAERWDFTDIKNFIDPNCKGCCLDGACPTCYGMNYFESGTLHTRPKDMCPFLKCEAFATSYLYGMMLANKARYPIVAELSDADKLGYVRGIEIVQRELADEVMGY